MAPFLMTLDDPNCRSWFRFLLLVRPFEPNYFRKYATDFCKLLPIGSITGVDNCRQIGLRSLKGRCHDNQFLFIQSTQFFSSQWPMCNERCVFSHDALDRRRYNTILAVIRRRFLLTTPIHRGTDISPGNKHSPWTFPWHSRATGYDKKCKYCAGRRRAN